MPLTRFSASAIAAAAIFSLGANAQEPEEDFAVGDRAPEANETAPSELSIEELLQTIEQDAEGSDAGASEAADDASFDAIDLEAVEIAPIGAAQDAAIIGTDVSPADATGGASNDSAAENDAPDAEIEETRADPAMWRVRDDDSEIWILGTFHILPPGVDWRSDALAAPSTRRRRSISKRR